MLFDSHIHIFPDKLKGKVLPKLGEISQSSYYRGETLQEALAENAEQGVSHALALHIATNPKQQSSVNDFAIASQTENLLCFGSVHPMADGKIEELHRIYENGLKGVKLHPDYQEFFTNDEKMADIYETCEKLGLIMTFHAGFDPYSPEIIHNPPKFMAEVAKAYPNLTLIAAHMGGMKMSDEVEKHLVGLKNVYFDTAMASTFLDVETFEKLVKLHGAEKILFATDSPWSKATDEKELIEKTSLSTQEKENIYYKNAFSLFNL